MARNRWAVSSSELKAFCSQRRVRSPIEAGLLQRSRVLLATFEFQDHSFDVFVVLVRLEELQTLLRIAPLENLNGFLACAPRVHIARVRHVKIDRVAT